MASSELLDSLFRYVGTNNLCLLLMRSLLLIGVSVLAHCVSRRVELERLTSWEGLKRLSWPRLCLLLIFIDSWLFLFSGRLAVLRLSYCIYSELTCTNRGNIDIWCRFTAELGCLCFCHLYLHCCTCTTRPDLNRPHRISVLRDIQTSDILLLEFVPLYITAPKLQLTTSS
jgi:hypothetical protein